MPDLSFNNDSYTPPDNLFAGDFPRAMRTVVLTGGAALLRGAVLGRTHVTATDDDGAAYAGNTGDGTIGTVSADDGAKKGVWRITCIEPAADGGTFSVQDPDGEEVGIAEVGAAFNGPINFTIADGATDFVAGDGFTVTVGEGTEKLKLAAAAAVDGSQKAMAILSEDADPSGGDVEVGVYLSGEFSEAALSFGAGHDADSVRADLEAVNIYLKTTVEA